LEVSKTSGFFADILDPEYISVAKTRKFFQNKRFIMEAKKKSAMKLAGALSSIKKKSQPPSRHDAILVYNEASRRLLDVNRWQEISGEGSAGFHIADHNGNKLEKSRLENGDLVKIVPKSEGNGTHVAPLWMLASKIEVANNMIKDEESLTVHLKTLHRDEAALPELESAGYVLQLKLKRNADVVVLTKNAEELPHKISPGYIFDRIRDTFSAFAAMLNGTSQWSNLAEGILKMYRG
jgi:hypothetical protein